MFSTLIQLREMANKIYPDTPGVIFDLVRIISAWAAIDPDRELSKLLTKSGLDVNDIVKALEPLLNGQREEDREIISDCLINAKDGPVTGVHLLRALCALPGNRITKALVKAGLNIVILKSMLDSPPTDVGGELARQGIVINADESMVLKYGEDLTERAERGEFDDLSDRPDDIQRSFEVLLRRNKANVALTGPPGVGKTALAYLIARKIVLGDIPDFLRGFRVFSINIGLLVAGTKYRGDFEQRLEELIKFLQASTNIILFIDEMHLLWGAGRAEGIITDAANLLKPFLTSSNSRVIAATTVQEYQRYIARDPALARRFQEIRLTEPDESLILDMVTKQAEAIAKHHGISIPGIMVQKAIELTNRHLPSRYQPDKSVDLLDSTSVSVHSAGRMELNIGDLLSTLSRQTGRPIASLTGDDRSVLRNLTNSLKKYIIGQDHVLEKVTATLIQRRQDIGNAERNLGTFIFIGDTGVGKTETARAIALTFFGSLRSLLQIDLAEYKQPGSTNRLIGSPPGYEGNEQEGVLIEWLHTYGSGVILLDEIEKASKEVQLLLLDLLDRGRISSSRGEILDARQCVIILTTNAVNADMLKPKQIGFGSTNITLDPEELLADYFPREFLGRLDEKLIFNTLGDKDMRAIMKLRIGEAVTGLKSKNLYVSFDEDRLIDYLMPKLKNNKSGARGIARLIEQQILQPIAMALLDFEEGTEVRIEFDDDFYESGKVKAMPIALVNNG